MRPVGVEHLENSAQEVKSLLSLPQLESPAMLRIISTAPYTAVLDR